MKLVTYEAAHKILIGVMSKNEEWIYPIQAFGMDYRDMQELAIGMGESEVQLLSHMSSMDPYKVEGAARVEEVKLLAPIRYPGQDVICVGINYLAHAEESARYKKEEFEGEQPCAVYFSKRVNEAVGHGEGIIAHEDIVDSLDYEVELGVILGRDTYCVAEKDAKDYIFGYTILNDVSARNIQTKHKQWFFGKSLDGFLPMGPCIVTADEIAYPPKLKIQSIVNGELRQDSSTELFVFDIDHVISELSQGMTLKAGTMISMGTPAGVGMGFDPPKFLKVGDEVECIIEGIGRIKNPVIA